MSEMSPLNIDVILIPTYILSYTHSSSRFNDSETEAKRQTQEKRDES